MAADAERLDKRELVERERPRGVELVRPQHEAIAQAAVGHDAEDLQPRAAVARPLAAGVAIAAVHVRLDRAPVAGPDVAHARADGEHLDAELVPRDAWVAVERHL